MSLYSMLYSYLQWWCWCCDLMLILMFFDDRLSGVVRLGPFGVVLCAAYVLNCGPGFG